MKWRRAIYKRKRCGYVERHTVVEMHSTGQGPVWWVVGDRGVSRFLGEDVWFVTGKQAVREAGPFPTLDAAKVAYIVMLSAGV